MNIPDRISERVETNFWIKNILMRIRDPESFYPTSGIWDPKHCNTAACTAVKQIGFVFELVNRGIFELVANIVIPVTSNITSCRY